MMLRVLFFLRCALSCTGSPNKLPLPVYPIIESPTPHSRGQKLDLDWFKEHELKFLVSGRLSDLEALLLMRDVIVNGKALTFHVLTAFKRKKLRNFRSFRGFCKIMAETAHASSV